VLIRPKSDLATLTNEVAGGTFAGKRMLVTGGAGFLGSWLCDFLIEAKALVDCVDDQSTGLTQNVDHLIGKGNFNFQKLDVTQGVEGSYDTILHLASHASPDEYQRHPVETLLVNSHGTQGLLELARRNDAVFFYSSTSEVYGDALVIPTPESYWRNRPIGPTIHDECFSDGEPSQKKVQNEVIWT
jgi:nucleoside-diphosphate-sugar epimerase